MFTTAVSENFYKTHGNQRPKNLLLSCHLLQKKMTSPWTYTKTNPTEEAPGTGTAAKGSNEYYFVGYLIKGHGNGRSFQVRMNSDRITVSSHSCRPEAMLELYIKLYSPGCQPGPCELCSHFCGSFSILSPRALVNVAVTCIKTLHGIVSLLSKEQQ